MDDKRREQETALVPQQGGDIVPSQYYVSPHATPERAKQMVEDFTAIKNAMVNDRDCIWSVGGRVRGTKENALTFCKPDEKPVGHMKKQAVLQFVRPFGINTEPLQEEWAEDGSWLDVTVRATHMASGIFATDVSSCEKEETKGKPISRHTMRSTAFTRARNRAILALIGGGEVSAEELTAGGEVDAPTYAPRDFGQGAEGQRGDPGEVRDEDQAPSWWIDGVMRASEKTSISQDRLEEHVGKDIEFWSAGDCRAVKAFIKKESRKAEEATTIVDGEFTEKSKQGEEPSNEREGEEKKSCGAWSGRPKVPPKDRTKNSDPPSEEEPPPPGDNKSAPEDPPPASTASEQQGSAKPASDPPEPSDLDGGKASSPTEEGTGQRALLPDGEPIGELGTRKIINAIRGTGLPFGEVRAAALKHFGVSNPDLLSNAQSNEFLAWIRDDVVKEKLGISS